MRRCHLLFLALCTFALTSYSPPALASTYENDLSRFDYSNALGSFCRQAAVVATYPSSVWGSNALADAARNADRACRSNTFVPSISPPPVCPTPLVAIPAYCNGSADTPCTWHCVDLRTSAQSSIPTIDVSISPVSSVTLAKKHATYTQKKFSAQKNIAVRTVRQTTAFASSAFMLPACPAGQHIDVPSCFTPSTCHCTNDSVGRK